MFLKDAIAEPLMENVDMGGGGGGDPITAAITSSLDGLEGREDSTPEPVVDDKQQPDPTEEQELAAIEKEIREKNPQMKGNIAIHRHQAVLTRSRNQHAKAVAEWEAKAKAWEESEKKYKNDLEGWGSYEWAKDPDMQMALQALALSEQDPRAFAELVLKDPRYSELLQFKDQAQPVPTNRPGPNAKSEDGSLEYYDDKGLAALLDFERQAISKDLTEKITQQISQQMEEKYGGVAKAYEHSTLWNTALAEQKVKLDTMREKWQGFKEFEKDIKAEMVKREEERKTNRNLAPLSPEEAYIMVVPGKLQERQTVNEKAMRDKILAELKDKKKAAGGTVKAEPVERGSEQGDRDLGDVIRASIAHLKE